MSDIESRIKAKVLKMTEDSNKAGRAAKAKKTEDQRAYTERIQLYRDKKKDALLPAVAGVANWCGQNGLHCKLTHGKDDSTEPIEMEFIPPGREQIEGGNLVISPDHTLETIHVTGIYGHSSGKPNFSPEPLVVATLTSESLKEVILNFIDQLLG